MTAAVRFVPIDCGGQHSSSRSCSLPPSLLSFLPSSHSLRYSSGVSPLLAPLGRSRAQLSPSVTGRPTATRPVRLLRRGHIQNTKDSSVRPALYCLYAFLSQTAEAALVHVLRSQKTVMSSLIMSEALIIPINSQAALVCLIQHNQEHKRLIVAINMVPNGL